ncbi:MAG: heme biosynthesis HemY N-terminal domain-containing protein [Lautropia sp.]
MLRNAIWLLLAFAVAVGLALVLRANHGNVAILWPPYRIELSSNMALLLTLFTFFVVYVLLRVLANALALPQRIRDFRERRRQARASRSLQGAVLALFEGRYERSEKLAAAAATASDEGGDGVVAAALLAARSAHRLGAPQRRDDWLRQADVTGSNPSALLITKAEFALDDRDPNRALDAIDRIIGTQQPVALETALGAYRQSGRWDRVLETLRQLTRRGQMPAPEADALRVTAYRQLLGPREGDAKALRELWKSMKAEERKQSDLAAPTVAALARAAAPDDARRIAIAVLDAAYDEATVEAYGAMAALPARQRLEQLEHWRTRYGDKPKLLEMLGRVCASEKLWGKAEAYLIGSLAAGDSVSARVALAQLYESIDRPRDAALQYRHGARLALGERPPLPAVAGPAAAGGAPTGGQTLPASLSGAITAAGIGSAAVDTNTAATVPADAAPASDAAPAVDLEARTGDELGLIRRKE